MLDQVLAGLAAYRVLDVPRGQGPDHDDYSAWQRQSLAALTTAFFQNAEVAFGWQRSKLGGPIQLFVAGSTVAALGQSTAQPRPSAAVALTIPAGAHGQPRTQPLPGALTDLAYWVRISGRSDIAPKREDQTSQALTQPTLEDCLEAWQGPFAWLVVATPLASADIRDLRTPLATDLPGLKLIEGESHEHELDRERDELWYRELRKAELTGLWRIHAFAGSETASAAMYVAGLLCGTSDVGQSPYVLTPDLQRARGLADWLARSPDAPAPVASTADAHSPFLAATEFLAELARPPRRELYGLRMTLPPDFDIMAESEGGIALWPILDQRLTHAGTLTIPPSTLLRHTFVCGATGSGKSQTVRALLERVSDAHVPWLVIEPAKREYADGMAGRLGAGEVLLIRPGDPELLPVSLNPLEPAAGYPLQSHLDMMRALFLAAFEAEEPFPQVLAQALVRCYERRGWNLARGRPRYDWVPPGDRPPSYPILGDLQVACAEVVERIGYSTEIRDNVRGFVDVRIGSLRLGSPGRFFEGGHPLDFKALLRQNVVLEMENLTNDQDKAFLMGVFLVRLVEELQVEYRRQQHERKRSGGPPIREMLRHVTVVEEAHRLLKNVPPEQATAAHAIEVFASLLAEIRAYGEAIVIAEQIPTKLFPDVLKNTALKIVHRLPAADDRDAVGATMNLTQAQSEYVVTLRPGIAATFADGMDRPVLTETPHGEDREQGSAVDIPPLSGRRGTACGASCQVTACSLADMQAAEYLVEAYDQLALLVEIGLVSHLIGAGQFRIADEGWVRRLRAVNARTLECAIAGLVQAAVDARYPYIVEFYAPESLADHVAALIAHLLDPIGQRDPCAPTEARWRAGKYRLNDIVWMLSHPPPGQQIVPAHIRRNAAAVGVELKPVHQDAQLEELRAHPWQRYPHMHRLVWGDGRPARLARLARLPEAADARQAALEKALGFVVTKDKAWVLKQLFATP